MTDNTMSVALSRWQSAWALAKQLADEHMFNTHQDRAYFLKVTAESIVDDAANIPLRPASSAVSTDQFGRGVDK